MTHSEGDDIEYDKTTAIPPLTLIREVRKYDGLFGSKLPEGRKDQIWEAIHTVLYPNYQMLSEDTKNVIKKTVRKRWKSLRDAVVKDHRLRTENAAYAQKPMSQTVMEMQFLLPYIKTPRYRKNNGGDNYDDSNHSPDFCKLMNETTIDLTFQEENDDSHVQMDEDEMISSEALYPTVGLTTSESDSVEVEWKNGHCVPTSNLYNSTLNYTIREIEEPGPEHHSQPEVEFQENGEYVSRKRKCTDFDPDLQLKIVDLVERCNTESQDEDRMFLMSLLSDFKRVPVHKKLKVKSAFVTALSDALDN